MGIRELESIARAAASPAILPRASQASVMLRSVCSGPELSPLLEKRGTDYLPTICAFPRHFVRSIFRGPEKRESEESSSAQSETQWQSSSECWCFANRAMDFKKG